MGQGNDTTLTRSDTHHVPFRRLRDPQAGSPPGCRVDALEITLKGPSP
jgi:hypothetical protein